MKLIVVAIIALNLVTGIIRTQAQVPISSDSLRVDYYTQSLYLGSSSSSLSYSRIDSTSGRNGSIYFFSSAPSTPKGAVNLAINKSLYSLGRCTWASPDSIHICGCHLKCVADYNRLTHSKYDCKLRIGLLTTELPKETDLVQQSWTVRRNEIYITFTNRKGENPKTYGWYWNGKTFKLKK